MEHEQSTSKFELRSRVWKAKLAVSEPYLNSFAPAESNWPHRIWSTSIQYLFFNSRHPLEWSDHVSHIVILEYLFEIILSSLTKIYNTRQLCKHVVGIYYCFTMTLVAVSTIISTMIVYISQSNSQRPVPSAVIAVGYLNDFRFTSCTLFGGWSYRRLIDMENEHIHLTYEPLDGRTPHLPVTNYWLY